MQVKICISMRFLKYFLKFIFDWRIFEARIAPPRTPKVLVVVTLVACLEQAKILRASSFVVAGSFKT